MSSGPGHVQRQIHHHLSQHDTATVAHLCSALADSKGRAYDATTGGRSVIRDALKRMYRTDRVVRRLVPAIPTGWYEYALPGAVGDGWMTAEQEGPAGRSEMATRLAEAVARVQAADSGDSAEGYAAAVEALIAEADRAQQVLSR